MDEANIRLHTRLRFTALLQGRTQAAEDIWAAVRAKGRPELLPAALTAAEALADDVDVDADAVVAEAAEARDRSYAARAEKLRRAGSSAPPPATQALATEDGPDHGQGDDRVIGDKELAPGPGLAPAMLESATATAIPDDSEQLVDPRLVATVLATLRELAAALGHGRHLTAYDQASLELLWDQLKATTPC
jgi:ParB family chromosome partitioning protein